MHIVYAVTTCSQKIYEDLFAHVKLKPAAPAHKYHRILIEGLAANAKVDVVANPPVHKGIMEKSFINLPREAEGGAVYHHLPAIRNSLVKLVWVGIGTFCKTFSLIKKDSAVVVDCLHRTAALAALAAARVRGAKCVGIVTDLPEMLQAGSFSVKLAHFIIRHCTDYVFLTEAMNQRLNPKGKPYVILEGHADISMREHPASLEKKAKPRVCLYAGAISKQYGLDMLMEGFQKANIPNARLHLYGYCDFEEEVRAVAAEDDRILYGGLLMNHEVVQKEQEATLLVNPRPTTEEFVKYSFPSKTMEYMASGTPVLTTKLPGMPKDYYPHVYLLEQETAEGIAEKLTEVLAQTDEELFEKGRAAKEFILTTRSNVVQAAKILEMLET